MLYNRHFGFTVSPFELAPDPRFFVPVSNSTGTLAAIYYALRQRKGFVVMTGEVGTGKTFLIRALLQLLTSHKIPFANVFNPRLSPLEFLQYISFDLGIQIRGDSKVNVLRGLYNFLLAQLQKGLTTALVIDEAHRMPDETLEEIRLLTNLETNQHKLLQIILVGQPELDSKLDSFDMRQLKQRIALRCTLGRLTVVETRKYIEERLRRAGSTTEKTTIFPAETIEAIQDYSDGVPRLINSICDQCLLAAYARQLRSVSVAIVEEVAASFRLQTAAQAQMNSVASRSMDQSEAAKYLLRVAESMRSSRVTKLHRGFL